MWHRVYLFDFDGVLVDSMPYWAEKMLNILRINKIKFPNNIIQIITPLGDKGTAKYFREKLGATLTEDEMIMQMDEYALPKYCNEIALKPGVYEYLREKKDSCSLNILTASPQRMVIPCLKRNGIYQFFDNIWSCDDFGLTKSEPLIYQHTIEKLNTKNTEVVFFDDNINAIKAAKQAGIYTVGVYDKSSEKQRNEIRKEADMYINDFSKIIAKRV